MAKEDFSFSSEGHEKIALLNLASRLAKRARELWMLARGIYEAPDPHTREYIQRQVKLIQEMREKHLLSEDSNEAFQEYVQHGDAALYCKGAQAKQKFKESARLVKPNSPPKEKMPQ